MSTCSEARTGGRRATTCHRDGCGPRCPPIRSRNARVCFSVNWTNSSNKTPEVRANLPRRRNMPDQSHVSNRSLISSDHSGPLSAPAAGPLAVTHHREASRLRIRRSKFRQRLAEERSISRNDPESARFVPPLSAARTCKSTRPVRKCGTAMSPRSRNTPHDKWYGHERMVSMKFERLSGPENCISHINLRPGKNFRIPRCPGQFFLGWAVVQSVARMGSADRGIRREGYDFLSRGGRIERCQDQGESAQAIEGRVQDERGDEAPRPLVNGP